MPKLSILKILVQNIPIWPNSSAYLKPLAHLFKHHRIKLFQRFATKTLYPQISRARFRPYSPQLGFRLYISVFILNRVFRKRGFPEDHPALDYAFCIRCEE
nr:hypothetical protein CFP56_35046 [Quercus suber]